MSKDSLAKYYQNNKERIIIIKKKARKRYQNLKVFLKKTKVTIWV